MNATATPSITRRDHTPLGIVYMLGATVMFAGASALSKWLVATYPLFTLALSALFLREERFGPRVLLGVALTVAGVVVLARA